MYSLTEGIEDLKADRPRIRIGRTKISNIFIDDEKISKNHCEIILERVKKSEQKENNQPPIAWLTDKSTNGVWVNGKLIGNNKKIKLSHCDEITLVEPKISQKIAPKYRFFFQYANMPSPLSEIKEIAKSYKIFGLANEGGYGQVYLGRNIHNKELITVQAFENKIFYDQKELEHETNKKKFLQSINKLKEIQSENLVRIHSVITTEDHLYIIREYLNLDDLSSVIQKREKFPEEEARSIFEQIIQIIDFLHENEIVHRNIRPEILLIKIIDSKIKVVLSNRGIDNLIPNNLSSYTIAQRTSTRAPETLSPEFNINKPCDLWSAGVILYMLLSGIRVFQEPRKDGLTLYNQIEKAVFDFSPDPFSSITIAAKNLIRRLLHILQEYRPTTKEVLNHPWMANRSELIKYECEDLDEYIY
ncbi:serine/threonine-protein kinase dclk3 [Anaeramoeba flamelloides]|uniref:Serine/threonine-protein kinase dclk3 n=1 Tax=Anaeramoeba flamelloides TaxID=1746091 RepID=A0AAV7YM47_9EUKA|nr:serine/threonine-protein kinase dclk3 [Anaeramoeba flamelloides]